MKYRTFNIVRVLLQGLLLQCPGILEGWLKGITFYNLSTLHLPCTWSAWINAFIKLDCIQSCACTRPIHFVCTLNGVLD